MKKNLLLFCAGLCTSDLIIGSSNRQEDIKTLATKYVLLRQLKKNALSQKLIQAVRMRKGSYFLIDLVVNQGAEINARDMQGKTALIHAVILQDYPTVKTLLELGASLDSKDNTGKTAIEYSHEGNNQDIITLFFDYSYKKEKKLLKDSSAALLKKD